MPTEGLIFFARQGNVVRSNAHAARALAAMEVELKVNSRVSAFNEEFPETARMKLPEWIRPEWLEPIIDGGEKLGTALVLPARSGSGSQLRSSSGGILSKPEQAPRDWFEPILFPSPPLGLVRGEARE